MKHILSIAFAALAFLFSGHARAQFSQPPPTDKSPPVCSQQKSGGGGGTSVCKTGPGDPLPTATTLECEPTMSGKLYCSMYNEVFNGAQWVVLDPSGLNHYWAYILNGQERYLAPTTSNVLILSCGRTGRGYVRVTSAGVPATVYFDCSQAPL